MKRRAAGVLTSKSRRGLTAGPTPDARRFQDAGTPLGSFNRFAVLSLAVFPLRAGSAKPFCPEPAASHNDVLANPLIALPGALLLAHWIGR